jgi:amino acid adenylation domain-containing protein
MNISELEMNDRISSGPQQQEEWNRTGRAYPRHQGLGELFREQAQLRPNAVALMFDGRQISYGELNILANQMAHYLRRKGVGRETRVGLCLQRSMEMMIALLGIVKAGGAYVPLDANYPADRLTYMLQDADVEVLITDEKSAARLPYPGNATLVLQREWEQITRESIEEPEHQASGEELAYIIYTSGSTGRPKGVSVIHRNVARLVKNTDYVQLDENHILLQFAPVSFDAATFEIWGALLNGAQLKIFPAYTPSPQELAEWLEREPVTTLWLTAGLFHQMAEGKVKRSFQHVRQLLAGGDVLSAWHVNRFLRECGHCRLINGYGPTENTTFSACAWLTTLEEEASVPIGHPISNSTVYILDEEMNAVPAGVTGELYLGGEGLARGYWGRPDLTAERFLPNPFSLQGGERLYRSGDLGRWREDGVLEFTGRRDQQVKLRGYRIELGEIEAVLEQHEDVRQAIVMAREDAPGDKRLAAYVTGRIGTVSAAELRQYVAGKLPDYMVPASFVMLPEFPLTANGKVDPKRLPAPPEERPELEQSYEAPRTTTEYLLCGIWQEVLRVKRVGVHDNFFDLGGHSLLATQIISRARTTFDVALSLRSIFENPVLSGQALHIESAQRGSTTCTGPAVIPVPRDQDLPLSFSQERVWFLQELDPSNSAYYFQAMLRLTGALDVPALQRALNEMVGRHEMLRTTFEVKNRRPVQVIHEPWSVSLPVIPLHEVQKAERETKLLELIDRELAKRFDVTQLPLIRWVLFSLDEQEHVLLHMEHHLIHDGWGFNVFLGELLQLYSAFITGKPSPLPSPQLQFADFAVWQKQYVESEEMWAQRSYWKAKLSGDLPVTEFPADRPRPPMQTFRGRVLRIPVPIDLCRKIRRFSVQEGTSLFAIMMAGYVGLTCRYTHQGDLCIGSTMANRQRPETEGLLGMLVNNVVLRAQTSLRATLRELLGHIQKLTLEAYDNQDVPFQTVVQDLQVSRDLSANPLFQMMFNFHNSPVSIPEFDDLKFQLTEGLGNGSAKFDMGVIVVPSSPSRMRLNPEWDKDLLTLVWEYNTDLFEEDSVSRIITHYYRLLDSIVTTPEQCLGYACLLTSTEQQQLVVECNRTSMEYPREKCIHELFEEQVKRTPESPAVKDAESCLTYEEFNRRANRLARYIRSLGVTSEDLVGVCLKRGTQMLAAVLGVLKAGAAYVPLDPTYPAERISWMLQDSAVALVLTQSELLDRLPLTGSQKICLDQSWGAIAPWSEENLGRLGEPENLAYVIYTSGSTGKPKGALIPGRAVVNFLCYMKAHLHMNEEDVLVALTTLSFDIAVLELLLPLISGAQTVIETRESATDGAMLAQRLNAHKATMMQGTPSTWKLLLETGWKGRSLKALCGGEALNSSLAEPLLQKCGTLWNVYGPTETTIWSLSCPIEHGMAVIPLGQPIANTYAYVLDEELAPVPLNVAGELYIAGEGLARGYLHRPDLTAERFVPDPFSKDGGALMYRTGDLVRRRSNGAIEFLGRADSQIKLRGYRIELGEIESTLRAYSGIGDATVLVREDNPGDKRLIAYFVGKPNSPSVNTVHLREFLRTKLPEYMLPAGYIHLDSFPLTPNGKLDRKALPRPDYDLSKDDYIAPGTPLEETLCTIWAAVLHIDQIGMGDHFFRMGGHSLLATQVIARVRELLYVDLPLRTLFENPCITQFASVVQKALLEKVEELSEEEAEELLKSVPGEG